MLKTYNPESTVGTLILITNAFISIIPSGYNYTADLQKNEINPWYRYQQYKSSQFWASKTIFKKGL